MSNVSDGAHGALAATLARHEEERRRFRLEDAAARATEGILQSLVEDPTAEALQALVAERLRQGGSEALAFLAASPAPAPASDTALGAVLERLDALSRLVEGLARRPDAGEVLAREGVRLARIAADVERLLAGQGQSESPRQAARAAEQPLRSLFDVPGRQEAPSQEPARRAPVPAATEPSEERASLDLPERPRRRVKRVSTGQPRRNSGARRLIDVALALALKTGMLLTEEQIKQAAKDAEIDLDAHNPRYIQNALSPYWLKLSPPEDAVGEDSKKDMWWPADHELPGGVALTKRFALLPRTPLAFEAGKNTVSNHNNNYPDEEIVAVSRKGRADDGLPEAGEAA